MTPPDLEAAMDDQIGDDLLAADLHRVPPGAVHRGPGGADAAAARRADHRRDRPRLPGPRADGGPADRPRQADAGRGARAVRAPAGAELSTRLASVLEVVYLIFNEGYSATAGDDWMRPALCEDALRLGRVLAGLAPRGAGGARPGGADGDPGVPQPRPRGPGRRADPAARPGPRALGPPPDPPWAGRARAGRGARRPLGPYALQAAIAACHARALRGRGHRLGADRRPVRRAGPARRRRSWSSTGPSRCPWRTARRPAWSWSTSSWRAGARRATTCCRPCAATCWRSWAAGRGAGRVRAGRRP